MEVYDDPDNNDQDYLDPEIEQLKQEEIRLANRNKFVRSVLTQIRKSSNNVYRDLWNNNLVFNIQKSYLADPFSVKPTTEENYQFHQDNQESTKIKDKILESKQNEMIVKEEIEDDTNSSSFLDNFQQARTIILSLIALKDVCRIKDYIKPFVYAGHLFHLNKFTVENLQNSLLLENPLYIKLEFSKKLEGNGKSLKTLN